MTKKNENEPTKKTEDDSAKNGAKSDGGQIGARQQLLARVAGDVASGIVSAPSESAVTAKAIAAIAVDIAEEILKKAGL